MINLDEYCINCNIFNKFGKRIYPSINRNDYEIIIVGQNPKSEDLITLNPFSGRAGNFLKKCLSDVGINLNNCYFTNAVKCCTSENKEPAIDVVQKCHSILQKELDQFPNKKIIVTLGKIAVKAVLSNLKTFSMDKIAGSFFDYEKDPNVKVFVVKHPSYLLKSNSPFLFREFISHLSKINLYLKQQIKLNDTFTSLNIYNEENLHELVTILNSKENVSFDIETNDLCFWKSKLLCFSFCDKEKNTYVVESWKISDDKLKWFFQQIKNVKLILHNAEFDMKHILYKYDTFLNLFYDTMQAQHVLDEESVLDLGTLSINLLNAPAYKNSVDFWKLDEKELNEFLNSDKVNELYIYNAFDTFYTYKLYELQLQNFETEKSSKIFYDSFIIPFLKCVILFTILGIPINVSSLIEIKKELTNDININENKIYSIAGGQFNHKSTDQLAIVLEKLGLNLDLLPKTELANKPQLSKDILQKISEGKILSNDIVKEFVNILLDIRAKQKLLSTYISQIDKFLYENKYTCVPSASPSFKLHASVTYRFNTENPNIHNINRGSIIKKMFSSRDGYYFVGADYESAEAFHAALQSGETRIIDFVLNPELDQHKYTASVIFNKPEDQITKEERTIAKIIWFLVQYGGTEYAASEELKISIQDAVKIIQGIKKAYPRLFNLLDSFKIMARTNKVLINRFGAVRRFKMVKDSSYERQAVNFPIQSEVSIYTHLAMLDLTKIAIFVGFDKMRPLYSIHDALYFEIREDCLPLSCAIISKVMQLERKGMYLKTTPDIGKCWYDLKNIKDFDEKIYSSFQKYESEYELKDLIFLLKNFKTTQIFNFEGVENI